MFEVTRAGIDATSAKLAQLRKFLDLPQLQKRLAELEAQMASDTFWGNQDAARKVIDEANGLKKKVEPMTSFAKRVDDLSVLLELGEAEPAAGQDAIQREADVDLPAGSTTVVFSRVPAAWEMAIPFSTPGPHHSPNTTTPGCSERKYASWSRTKAAKPL